jgi:Holliday junction resolvase RusA-like endonuclease
VRRVRVCPIGRQWEARAQWERKPFEGDIAVEVTLYFGTKRRADWDNFHKLSMDALNGIAYLDDSQIKRALVKVDYDKFKPRVEVILSKV